MATALKVVYASAPTDSVIIQALQIKVAGEVVHRICLGYEDLWLYPEGEPELFIAGQLQISLPAKDNSGQQTLRFGMAGVNGEAQKAVDNALEANEEVAIEYYEFLQEDVTAPAKRPYIMTVTGGTFEGIECTFEASYYDMLNAAWPRDRYTQESAPGVQYL